MGLVITADKNNRIYESDTFGDFNQTTNSI